MGKKKVTSILMICTVAAIIIIVAVVVWVSGKETRERNKHLNLGQKYLAEMNYEEAIASFEKAIEIDPISVEAYLGMADAYIAIEKNFFEIGNLESAKAAISEAKAIVENGIDVLTAAANNSNIEVDPNAVSLLEPKVQEIQGEIDKIEAEEEIRRLAEEARLKAEEEARKKAEEEARIAALPYIEIQSILDATSDVWGKPWDEWTIEEFKKEFNPVDLKKGWSNRDLYGYLDDAGDGHKTYGQLTHCGNILTDWSKQIFDSNDWYSYSQVVDAQEKGRIGDGGLLIYSKENKISSVKSAAEFIGIDENLLIKNKQIEINTDYGLAKVSYNEYEDEVSTSLNLQVFDMEAMDNLFVIFRETIYNDTGEWMFRIEVSKEL